MPPSPLISAPHHGTALPPSLQVGGAADRAPEQAAFLRANKVPSDIIVVG